MKRFLPLLVLCCLSIGLVQAQNLVFSTDQHISVTLEESGINTLDIKFKTPTVQAVTYHWTLIENSLPENWSYSLCDYGSCYTTIPETGEMSAISQAESQDGTEGFFKLIVNPVNNYGEGLLKMFVFDSNNPSLGDTVSYYVNFPDPATVGINYNTLNTVVLYPNPATDLMFIDNPQNEVLNIEIYNTLGLLVRQMQFSDVSNKLDVSSLSEGRYFVRISDENGNLSTKSLIIQ